MQRISRVSGYFRKTDQEEDNDSRRFQDNSLLARAGNFLAEQGIQIPCSVESSDISRVRAAFGSSDANAASPESSEKSTRSC
jgi:hypothetical protein